MVLFIFMRFHINIPGPGTELRILTARVLFSISYPSQLIGLLIDKSSILVMELVLCLLNTIIVTNFVVNEEVFQYQFKYSKCCRIFLENQEQTVKTQF